MKHPASPADRIEPLSESVRPRSLIERIRRLSIPGLLLILLIMVVLGELACWKLSAIYGFPFNPVFIGTAIAFPGLFGIERIFDCCDGK